MAASADYDQAKQRAHDLLIIANKLHTLIDQILPPNPLLFSAAVQHIDEIQKHLNNLRTPIQHLSQQSNIDWAPDNLGTRASFEWLALIIGLVSGLLVGLVVK